MNRISILFCSLLIVLISCDSKPFFEQKVNMENGIWNRFNSLKFEVDFLKEGVYDIDITVSYDTTYAYSNLNIDVGYAGTDGETRIRPHNISLKSSEGLFFGKSLGNGKIETTYEAVDGLSISRTGRIIFTIDNVMPVFDLKGVHQVGLIARKHSSEK